MRWFAILAALWLAGCAQHYDVYVLARTSADQGHATITVNPGHPGGDFALQFHGKQYEGRWVYMANGGSAGVGTVIGSAGTHVATASATAFSVPTQGGGSIFAAAPDGSALHCQYDFNNWTRSGVGVCQDNDGSLFDLQINPI